jgi:hypothetical protein
MHKGKLTNVNPPRITTEPSRCFPFPHFNQTCILPLFSLFTSKKKTEKHEEK